MSSALDQAQNFSGGVVSAARKRERWLRKAANTSNEETAAGYREAAADLAARFPEIEEIPIGGAEAFARDRGHGTGARSPVHGGRKRQRPGTSSRPRAATPPPKPKTAPSPKPSPGSSRASSQPSRGPSRASSRSSSRRAAPAPRPTPRVDRAIRQTGIPQAVAGSGSATMALLGGTVGLAFGYLVLVSAETPGSGVRALPSLIGKHGSIPRALARFLSPEADVFPGSSASGQRGSSLEQIDPGAKNFKATLPEYSGAANPGNPFAAPVLRKGAARVRADTRHQQHQRRQRGNR